MEKNSFNNEPKAQEQKMPARANEQTGLNIDEFLRITDPQTQEVILEKRA